MTNASKQSCTCSICHQEQESDNVAQQEKKWNAYTSAHFGDQTHVYTFCESCLNDMMEGNPLKGKLEEFITADPELVYLYPEEREKLDRKKYADSVLKHINS